MRAPAPAPPSLPLKQTNGPKKNISVEDVVMWEKATGRQWHKLTAAEKIVETDFIRNKFHM